MSDTETADDAASITFIDLTDIPMSHLIQAAGNPVLSGIIADFIDSLAGAEQGPDVSRFESVI